MINIPLSDEVVREVLKLQAIEEGRQGNYTNVDERVDKLRYRVADLVMGSVMRKIHELQANPRIWNSTDSK